MKSTMIKRIIQSIRRECQHNEESLEELKEMTLSLPPWERRWSVTVDRIVEVDTLQGKSIVRGLHKEPMLAVALCDFEPGTIYDWHSHDENEYFLVYLGAAIIEFEDGKKHWLHMGDFMEIPAKQVHRAITNVKTSVVAMTIPAAHYFPNGGRWSEGRDG